MDETKFNPNRVYTDNFGVNFDGVVELDGSGEEPFQIEQTSYYRDSISSIKSTSENQKTAGCCSSIIRCITVVGKCVLCPLIAICKWVASFCGPNRPTLQSILTNHRAALEAYNTSKEPFLAKLINEFLADPAGFQADFNGYKGEVKGDIPSQVAAPLASIQISDATKTHKELLKAEIRGLIGDFVPNLDNIVYTNMINVWMEDPQMVVNKFAEKPYEILEKILCQALQNPRKFVESLAKFKTERNTDRYVSNSFDEDSEKLRLAKGLLAVAGNLADAFQQINMNAYPSDLSLQKAIFRLVFCVSNTSLIGAINNHFTVYNMDGLMEDVASKVGLKRNTVDRLMENPEKVVQEHELFWVFWIKFLQEAQTDPQAFYESLGQYGPHDLHECTYNAQQKLENIITQMQKSLITSDWARRESEHAQILTNSLKFALQLWAQVSEDDFVYLLEEVEKANQQENEQFLRQYTADIQEKRDQLGSDDDGHQEYEVPFTPLYQVGTNNQFNSNTNLSGSDGSTSNSGDDSSD